MLTTLANLKAWAAITSSTDDVLLTRLINDSSNAIMAYIQRAGIFKTSYADLYDGYGTNRQMIDQWPVLAVSSVVNENITVPALQPPLTGSGSGYVLEPWNGSIPGQQQALTYRGGVFCYGHSNIAVNYTAGYAIANEAWNVPSPGPYTVEPLQPKGNWGQDDGVTYANGTALAKVGGTPSAGQYSVSSTGVYTFASADAGAAVLISYSYIPFDIEQACIEIATERYKYRSRIGQKSAAVSGAETASYDMSGMTDPIKVRLRPYVRKALM